VLLVLESWVLIGGKMNTGDVKFINSAGEIEATAGTTNEGDVFIRVKPLHKGEGVRITLQSRVESLYKDEISKVVRKKLQELGVSDIYIEINDRGALDYVLNARLETAILRTSRGGR
jgi:citrate lyase subunit gamma (acyl carrier protein)